VKVSYKVLKKYIPDIKKKSSRKKMILKT